MMITRLAILLWILALVFTNNNTATAQLDTIAEEEELSLPSRSYEEQTTVEKNLLLKQYECLIAVKEMKNNDKKFQNFISNPNIEYLLEQDSHMYAYNEIKFYLKEKLNDIKKITNLFLQKIAAATKAISKASPEKQEAIKHKLAQKYGSRCLEEEIGEISQDIMQRQNDVVYSLTSVYNDASSPEELRESFENMYNAITTFEKFLNEYTEEFETYKALVVEKEGLFIEKRKQEEMYNQRDMTHEIFTDWVSQSLGNYKRKIYHGIGHLQYYKVTYGLELTNGDAEAVKTTYEACLDIVRECTSTRNRLQRIITKLQEARPEEKPTGFFSYFRRPNTN